MQHYWLLKGKESSKLHLINWKIVSRPKKHGSLALGEVIKKNIALLGKWICPLKKKQFALWASIIRSKSAIGRKG